MAEEGLEMSELLFFAICFLALALTLCYRLWRGPSVADRAIAADCVDMLTDMALILFALYSHRGIFLDIALVTAVLGVIGSTFIAKYLEGKL